MAAGTRYPRREPDSLAGGYGLNILPFGDPYKVGFNVTTSDTFNRPRSRSISRPRKEGDDPVGGKESISKCQGIIDAGNDLGMEVIRSMAIPLPPLAKQHRIVAEVEELMELCDQVESKIFSAETDSQRLVEAVLRDALAPALAEPHPDHA